MELRITRSVVTLNVNGLNTQIKKSEYPNWDNMLSESQMLHDG